VVANDAFEIKRGDFTGRRLLLRTWWLPDYEKLLTSDFLPYLIYHKTSQETGKVWYKLFIRETAEGRKR